MRRLLTLIVSQRFSHRTRHTNTCTSVTTQTTPEGATHWSTRKLAAKLGISDTTVLKVWQANGLKPHRVETFKVSRDPKFVARLTT